MKNHYFRSYLRSSIGKKTHPKHFKMCQMPPFGVYDFKNHSKVTLGTSFTASPCGARSVPAAYMILKIIQCDTLGPPLLQAPAGLMACLRQAILKRSGSLMILDLQLQSHSLTLGGQGCRRCPNAVLRVCPLILTSQ